MSIAPTGLPPPAVGPLPPPTCPRHRDLLSDLRTGLVETFPSVASRRGSLLCLAFPLSTVPLRVPICLPVGSFLLQSNTPCLSHAWLVVILSRQVGICVVSGRLWILPSSTLKPVALQPG